MSFAAAQESVNHAEMVSSQLRLWVVLGAATVTAVSCSGGHGSTPTGDAVGGAGAANDAGAPGSNDAGAGTGSNEGGAGQQPDGGASGQPAGGAASSEMTDGWLSGTRLRAVLDVAGSAKMFTTWHDAMLDIDCNFAIDAHNVERCMPLPQTYAFYADDKCMKPIVLLNAGDAIPSYVVGPLEPFECGHGSTYYTLGADATATTIYSKQSGTCAMNGDVGATQTVKALGKPIAETTFVAATETVHEARDERLSATVRVAEDGSRQVISHFDLERQADCNPRQHQGDGYACVPEDRAYIEYFFSDKGCKVPAAYHPAYAQQVCGHEPAIIQNSSPYYTDGYYEVGKQVTGAVFRSDGPNCDPYVSPGDPAATYFSVGTEVAWSSFPPLSSKNEGAGRISINVLRGPADELVSREQFFDTTLGFYCGAGQTTDLKTRCIPFQAGSASQFADSKCSKAVFANPAGAPLPEGLEFIESNAPTGGVAIFKLGAKIGAPAQVWSLNGLDCQLAAVNDPDDYYSTTALLPSELALVTREVE
jgi:hypothetical protein